MDDNEVRRLAGMANQLRPDWPTKSIETFIVRNFASRAPRDVAVALAWVCFTKTETPRLLLESGPWWKAAATETTYVQRPPRKTEECPLHAGHWRDSCHGCAADRLAATKTTPPNLRKGVNADALAAARAELARVKAARLAAQPQPEADEQETA